MCGDASPRKVQILRILRLLFPRGVGIGFQNPGMLHLFQNQPIRFYALVGIFICASPFALSQGSKSGNSLAQEELDRRKLSLDEGQMLLEKGDKAYVASKYEEAAAAYAAARESFPEAPATEALRDAATQRYVQASIEHGRLLAKGGDMAGAKATMDKVLQESVAPSNPEALAFRAELDDPIRYNPALTKEHAADVDEVRRLLYTAQGASELGKYDQAQKTYQDVLRIDPYNSAARRGMEEVSRQKSAYYGAALDHTRGELLSMVDGAWELQPEANLTLPDLQEVARVDSLAGDVIPLANKLERIIVPEYRLEQGNLVDAIELLRLRAAENDPFAPDPSQAGINVAINLGDPAGEFSRSILAKTFDLQVSNVPVEQLLKYITDISGTSFQIDDFAVTISSPGASENELFSRTYRVPPDFLSNLTAGGGAAGSQAEDVFSSDAGQGGILAERVGPQQALEQQGVVFPEGASASFNGATNTLRVVNTRGGLDIIEQIIDVIAQTEPVSVAVRVTMIKVEQDQLEELGFDWLLDNVPFGGQSFIPGANELNLTGGTTGNGSAITDIARLPGSVFPGNPITSGNRSGDEAFGFNSIDSLIASGSSGGFQTVNRAPGVLGVNAVIGGATVQSLLRGLNQKTGVDLISQPSVTTRSGQAASVRVVDEFIYPTEYEPPELPNTVGTNGDGGFPVTPSTPTAFETREVGISLDVLPVADANRRYVDVTLTPSVIDFDGFVNFGSPITSIVNDPFLGPVSQVITENAILMPVFSRSSTNSNLWVLDGSTIVIGGLLTDEAATVQDKTPILGDLPIVGRLFQSNARNHRSTAILFLVNVELLDPTGRPYRER